MKTRESDQVGGEQWTGEGKCEQGRGKSRAVEVHMYIRESCVDHVETANSATTARLSVSHHTEPLVITPDCITFSGEGQ